jgi:hypothetical protein
VLLQKSGVQLRGGSWKNAAGRRKDQLPPAAQNQEFCTKTAIRRTAKMLEKAPQRST